MLGGGGALGAQWGTERHGEGPPTKTLRDIESFEGGLIQRGRKAGQPGVSVGAA